MGEGGEERREYCYTHDAALNYCINTQREKEKERRERERESERERERESKRAHSLQWGRRVPLHPSPLQAQQSLQRSHGPVVSLTTGPLRLAPRSSSSEGQ